MEDLHIEILVILILAVAGSPGPERTDIVDGLRRLGRKLLAVLILFGLGLGSIHCGEVYLLGHEGTILVQDLPDGILVAVFQAVIRDVKRDLRADPVACAVGHGVVRAGSVTLPVDRSRTGRIRKRIYLDLVCHHEG